MFRKLIMAIAVVTVLNFVSHANAASFFVTQKGSGNGDGSSLSNSMSVSTHNSHSFKPGDVIYLSGKISSQITVNSSGSSAGGYITYDGFEAGDCDPLNKTCNAALISTEGTGGHGFYIHNKDYIVIQDLVFSDTQGCGVYLQGDSYSVQPDHITIRRNEMHDIDTKAINISFGSFITIGGHRGQGNKIYDIGTDTSHADIGVASGDDLIISYNHLYATKRSGASTDRGIDGIVVNRGRRILIEYNTINDHRDCYGDDAKGEDGIDLKGKYDTAHSKDVIIRYNNIYNNRQSNITVQGEYQNVIIHGNNLHNASIDNDSSFPGLLIEDGGQYLYVWSNVISKNKGAGISVQGKSSGADPPMGHMYFFNNTIAENSTGGNRYHGGISVVPTTNIGDFQIKNNIFYHNQPNIDTYRQIWGSKLSLEGNHYYFDGITECRVRIGSTDYPISKLPSGYENKLLACDQGDPNLGTDYRLVDNTSCWQSQGVMNAVNIPTISIQSATYVADWADSIDSDRTDWNAIPPIVTDIKQGTNSNIWVKGAYQYPIGDDAITNMLKAPTGLTFSGIVSNKE